MKNKRTIILIIILILLIGLIVLLGLDYFDENKFYKPSFDHSAIKTNDGSAFKESKLNISDDYSFYISGNPYLKDNYIYIDFYSFSSDDLYLKVRILDEDNMIVAESGLIKKNEYLNKIRLKKNISVGDKLTYLIMSYEKDTYYSLGEVKLKVEVGSNE